MLAVGTESGNVQIWDAQQMSMVREMSGHKARVGAIAWNSSHISSGSRDRNILHRDFRAPQDFQLKFSGHRQEVCGLKWSHDGQQLASGGNDNKLFLWDARSNNHLAKFSEHLAAVKAITWSPHQVCNVL